MSEDTPAIWVILSAAIERRKADGSNQWQDGYPNEEVIANDIAHQYGYVLTEGDEILGYVALFINFLAFTFIIKEPPMPTLWYFIA